MPYPGNTARCVFEFSMPNGDNAFCTPHVRSLGGADLTQGDVEAIADLLDSWATVDNFEGETNFSLMDYGPTELTLTSISVTGLAAVTPPQFTKAVNQAGASTNTPLPNETSTVVTLYTGIVGRSYRGRNFWPTHTIGSMSDNGTYSDTTRANLQATFDALIAGLVTDGNYVLAVNSNTLPGVNQVISAVVRDTFHHQRRRNS